MVVKRIAIDMDEVIADAGARFFEWYERDYGLKLPNEKVHGKYFFEVVDPEHKPAVKKYPWNQDFFKDLEVIEGSKEVISELVKKYEVFITTAAMEFPHSFTPKLEWLNKHFPYIPWQRIVFCGDKSIIHADYLIDDHVRHFANFVGQGILFTAPHNINVDWKLRVKNWKEVGDMFL
ncbi:MAG: 5' nucleotidase, NT5C type [Flavisolibacter sp.]